MGFRLIGAGPAGASTTTQATKTFDSTDTASTSTNFGLSRVAITSGGSPSAYGGVSSLGVVTATIDGLELSIFTNTGVTGAFNLYFGATKVVSNWGFNSTGSLYCLVNVPIRIPSGTDVGIEIAATGAGNGAQISAKGYQTSVPESITSWAGLGPVASMQSQGVVFAGGSTPQTWTTVGTLAADAKAFSCMAHYGNDTSRTGGNEYNIDVGKGDSGSEAVLIPRVKAKDTSTTNVIAPGTGTHRISVPSGTRIAARATSIAGTLPDNLGFQVMVGY